KLKFKSEGFESPKLKGGLVTKLDLEKFQNTLGLSKHDLRGKIDLSLEVDGIFKRDTNLVPTKKNRISSIPTFQLEASIKDGYIKNLEKDAAIRNINFDMIAS